MSRLSRPFGLFTLLCLALAPGLLLANAPETAQVRFLFVDEAPGAYAVEEAGRRHHLGAYPYAITPPRALAVPGDHAIWKELPAPDSPAPRPVRVGTLSLRPGMRSVLAVITPRPAASPELTPIYQVQLHDASPTAFPADAVRLLNLASVELAARFGDQTVRLAPGESRVLRPVLDARRRVRTQVARADGGAWEPIYDSVTTVRPGQRVTGVLVFSPSGLIHTYTQAEIDARGRPPPAHVWLTYSDAP